MWFFAASLSVHVYNNAHCIIAINCLMRCSFIKVAQASAGLVADEEGGRGMNIIADNLLIYGKTGINVNLMHYII